MTSWMDNPDIAGELSEKFPDWKAPGSTGAPVREYVAPVNGTRELTGREEKYARSALESQCADLAAMAKDSGRNDFLNTSAFKMRQYVSSGWLTQNEVINALLDACRINGLLAEDGQGQCLKTIYSGLRGGGRLGEREIEWKESSVPFTVTEGIEGYRGAGTVPLGSAGAQTPATNGHDTAGRQIKLRSYETVVDDLPDWVWHYHGKGRIQLGTLVMLAGRPGAGKSTAARWFASQLTNGKLEGIWLNEPVNVAYMAAEEQIDVLVKPSLRAAGADMSRIYDISAEDDGREVRMISLTDEHAIIDTLLQANVRVLIVDPVMATIGANVEINKNNEVRAYMEPYARIAKAINGIVLGIAHLNKQAAKDVVAGINGSSAFGEVPRAVFGFAKDESSDEGDRIMSQSKNSAGAEDLALIYRIETTTITTEKRGRAGEMAYFNIIGISEVSVEEVMTAEIGQHTVISEVREWLHEYLEINGSPTRQAVLKDAKDQGYSESTIKRAARDLRVQSRRGASTADRPRVVLWELPPMPGADDRTEPRSEA